MEKKLKYLDGKHELRLLKVKIHAGLKNPIRTHPAPIMIHVIRARIKHVMGEEINLSKAGDAFLESNNGGVQTVKIVGEKPGILRVEVVSVVGMPNPINKFFPLSYSI